MSKLLLDTHVLLWSVLEPARLSGDAKKQLEDPAFELWLSPISTWEIMVLSEKGRIALGTSPEVFMQMVFSSTPLREAPSPTRSQSRAGGWRCLTRIQQTASSPLRRRCLV